MYYGLMFFLGVMYELCILKIFEKILKKSSERKFEKWKN